MLLSVLLIIAILGGMTWYFMAKGLNIFSCNYWPFCHLLLEGNAMTNLDSILKSRDITLPTKVCLVKAMVFPVVWMWELDYKESWVPNNWCFWSVVLEKTLESLLAGEFPLDRRSNLSILKEISPEYSLERLMPKLKLQSFGNLMWRTDSLEKILMLGKTEDRRRRG